GVFAVRTPGGGRFLALRRLSADRLAALVATPGPAGRIVVEDPFGVPDVLVPAETTVLRVPVVVRPPAAVGPAPLDRVSAVQVRDVSDLEQAERVIVDGFPQRHLQPWTPGQALPPRVLELPGWRVWLARREGVPAAAGYTYDDGHVVGIYWLTTLPE